ncbi:long-chain fatty acid transporter [Sulfurifustis variabilis]|uniref:Long-chain fatty acid transporter n=1 Tax=Sulfurifustis variabilis TaxID=1675686 RepID=A0A1B4VDI9_9GAMM|nr:outer membrane protein transport protein [Sulfurifustis variabilis]BAU48047.1 long-chain fatty acid transporter [Sulfurifustis variabilis]
MKKAASRLLGFAIGLALSLPANTYATNGMFGIGYGAKATGMGGAGVAYPQDAMAVAYNPALMTQIDARFDVTLELLNPPRAVAHDSALLPTDERSRYDLFPVPALGSVLSDSGGVVAIGYALIGAGLGTDYKQTDGTFFDPLGGTKSEDRVGVFLMQMQFLPSIAYRINDNHSVGLGVVVAAQTFRSFGLEAFVDLGFSSSSEGLTNQGYDWGFGLGYRLGWFGTFLDKRLNLGLNWSPKVNMQRFNRYEGLFANRGEFDIPENFTVGLAYKLTHKSTVAFDVERIFWSEVPSIGNPGPLASDPSNFFPLCPPGTDPTPCLLGGPKGLGFGWENQTVYKIGIDYKYTPGLTFRAGYNYGKAPIPDDQVLFNMLAPATTEKHATLGATLALGKESEISFHLMHAFKNTIKGPTAFPPPGYPVTQGANASIAMEQTSIGVAYGAKF